MTDRGMEMGAGASYDYFSVDDILASGIMVPCKAEMELAKLGFLDPASNRESPDLPAGSLVELPAWAVKSVGRGGRRYFSPHLPVAYQDIYREVLKADPTVVDLNKVGPHFYDSGIHVASLQHPESDQLADILPNVLKLRLQKIANSYTYSRPFFMADEAPEKPKGNVINEATLDSLETQIYGDSKRAFAEVKEWMETEGRSDI